jgi:gluconolactonase
MGRVYVTYSEGIAVLSPEGKKLGTIPTPRGVITAAFGGKDKKSLYILARGAEAADGTQVANAAQVWVIPMIAQGFKGRAK